MENRNDILNELKEISTVVAAIKKVNVYTVPEGYFDYLITDILAGIENEKGLTVQAPGKVPDDVPVGYFDSLADLILDKIKVQNAEDAATEIKELSPVLSGLQKKNSFEIPVGYFDSLTDNLLQKIKLNDTEDASAEIRALSPMLYSIQNENVYQVPQGYFEGLSDTIINKLKPQPKVIRMQRRSSTFFKYAVAAAFTGVMALGVFKFTSQPGQKIALPDYVTAGLKVQDVDKELDKISDADIVKYLEAGGTDVKAAYVANSVDNNELPAQEDYLLDEQALDKYLNSINVDDLKN